MKVLLVTQVFPPQTGGSGRWLWELYRRLQDVDVHVAAAETARAEAFDGASPLPVTRIPLQFTTWGLMTPRGATQYWRAYQRLTDLVARTKPATLHCGKCLPEGLLALAIKRRHGLPYVCYVHGEELTLAALSRELRWLTTRVLGSASQVVANSHFSRDLLVREWSVPEHRITVLHPGVDTTVFRPAAPDSAVRTRLGWTGRRVVLTVGSLQKRKGQDAMIRALPAIRQACPDVLYVVAGEGWERDYLERLVDDYRVRDAVQFRGVPSDEELVACYQQCDLFALPNRQIGWDVEGFGMVLVEAQACGKPVIAGNSGGTVDTLLPGTTGELVDASSSDRIEKAVVRMLNDPARLLSMGRQAREWAVAQFGWDHMTVQARRVIELTNGRVHADRVGQPA